jgi:hypothetical protein
MLFDLIISYVIGSIFFSIILMCLYLHEEGHEDTDIIKYSVIMFILWPILTPFILMLIISKLIVYLIKFFEGEK